jgi:archaellum component FlaG (FlaF/FlaG flagellin family)
MKSFILSLLTAASLAATLNVAPAIAGAGHDHGPKYGGVVRELHNIAYELVARPDALTLYVSDHGKPVPTQGATAEAVIYAGNEKTAVKLEPAGENRMIAKGKFKVGVGVRVVLTTTLPGKTPAKATFKLK